MRKMFVVPVALAAAAMILTGCVNNADGGTSGDNGNSGKTGTSASNPYGVTKDAALAKLLPSKIADAGTLKIGTDPTYAPNEYKDDSGKIVGWDIDLGDAMAAKLGITATYTESKFDNIIPSITGGRYDMGISSFTDTLEREKQVDFVNYYNAGIMWASAKGETVDPNNACGLKVAVQAGTTEDLDELPVKQKQCKDAGKAAIQVFKFDGQDQATNALVLGQVKAMTADSPITEYAIHLQPDKLQAAGTVFEVAPYGFATAKGSEMTGVIEKTLQSLIDDGTYKKILDKWGVASGAVTEAQVNMASKK